MDLDNGVTLKSDKGMQWVSKYINDQLHSQNTVRLGLHKSR